MLDIEVEVLVLLLALRNKILRASGREVLTPEDLRKISAVAATCGRKNACLSGPPLIVDDGESILVLRRERDN